MMFSIPGFGGAIQTKVQMLEQLKKEVMKSRHIGKDETGVINEIFSDTLAHPPQGSTDEAIAGVAIEVADNVFDNCGSKEVFSKAFSMIKKNPQATPEEKKLIELYNASIADTKEADSTQIGKSIATVLAHPISTSANRLIAQIANNRDTTVTTDGESVVCRKALSVIDRNSHTTSDEKKLITLYKNMDDVEAGFMSKAVVNALAHPISGPVNRLIAQVASDAAYKAHLGDRENKIFKNAFSMIDENPQTTPRERMFVGFYNNTLTDLKEVEKRRKRKVGEDDAASVGKAIISALAQPFSGPTSRLVAQVAITAANDCTSLSSDVTKREIYNQAFSIIANNPEWTPEERKLAQLYKTSTKGMYIYEALNTGAVIANAVIHPIPGPINKVIAKAAIDASGVLMNPQAADKIYSPAFSIIGRDSHTSSEVKQLIELYRQKMDGSNAAEIGKEVAEKIIRSSDDMAGR